ncbi:alpha/beta hydrolase [Candidatus Saccharibacteria bacterium]|nr:alpha/beta hydrolase [Candidatus Saccharibacteria bacterium]
MKLYIVHGWTYDASPWEKLVKLLKEQGITAELLYVPGLTEPSSRVWTIRNYVSWANHNIPDGAIALGHSNGGRILLNLLSANPDKLKGVILLDSAGVYERSFKRSTLRVVAKIFAPLKHIGPLRKLFHKFIGASDYDKAPKNMKKTLHNMITSDKQLDVSKITTPTQIIWGAADTITPLRQGEKLHRLIKGSKLTIKQNWPHSPYLKTPEELAKVIKKSFEELNT